MDFNGYIVVSLLLISMGILASIVYWGLRLGITPTATSPKVREVLYDIVPTQLEKLMVVELGSGWGTLLPGLAHQFPTCQIIGYERSPVPWFFSRVRCANASTTQVMCQNFFEADLSNAGIVICYLQKDIMSALSKHLRGQLPPGCFILSHTFHLPGWKPIKTAKASDLYKTPIYLYQVSQQVADKPEFDSLLCCPG